MGTSIIKSIVLAAAMLAPAAASAQAPSDFKSLIFLFVDLLNDAIMILVALGLLVFIWGLAKFILSAGDTKAHDTGKALMTWGLLGLFVMGSIWGILGFLSGEFGFGTAAIRILPE